MHILSFVADPWYLLFLSFPPSVAPFSGKPFFSLSTMMATSRPYQPSSPYSLQHSSPLEALGRRQNIPQPVRLPPAHSSSSSRLNPQFTYPTQNSSSSSSSHLTTPPRQQPQHPGHHLTLPRHFFTVISLAALQRQGHRKTTIRT